MTTEWKPLVRTKVALRNRRSLGELVGGAMIDITLSGNPPAAWQNFLKQRMIERRVELVDPSGPVKTLAEDDRDIQRVVAEVDWAIARANEDYEEEYEGFDVASEEEQARRESEADSDLPRRVELKRIEDELNR